MNGITTSWIVVGIGVIVSLIGWLVIGGTLGAGILGFGLAWVLLGILDMFRPAVKAD
ncbi:MAG: hypothetical protein U1D96_02960 [Eubacteriales bacterium]|jgi:hypothetical protein|nr:hypothetical protein [Bacillota bacterium]MBV1728298.1 hypothetical protein [Desulforudis sp.]MDQ7789202.1 hypothetical protein [Clostridia bacterium]MDZ4042438.1 hypothetical protein [Eubacteriales bacterium]MBU4533846.1 hypothetical protein [Bacillota bacterium]